MDVWLGSLLIHCSECKDLYLHVEVFVAASHNRTRLSACHKINLVGAMLSRDG